MNKGELIEAFADHANLSRAEAGRQIDWLVTKIMTAAVENEAGAVIPGLGKLKVVETKARTGQVRTGSKAGETWTKAAGKKFKLVASTSAKDFL